LSLSDEGGKKFQQEKNHQLPLGKASIHAAFPGKRTGGAGAKEKPRRKGTLHHRSSAHRRLKDGNPGKRKRCGKDQLSGGEKEDLSAALGEKRSRHREEEMLLFQKSYSLTRGIRFLAEGELGGAMFLSLPPFLGNFLRSGRERTQGMKREKEERLRFGNSSWSFKLGEGEVPSEGEEGVG